MGFFFCFLTNLQLLMGCGSPIYIKAGSISRKLKKNGFVFLVMTVSFLLSAGTGARNVAQFMVFNAWMLAALKQWWLDGLMIPRKMLAYCLLSSFGTL
jgi:hypothetical protein